MLASSRPIRPKPRMPSFLRSSVTPRSWRPAFPFAGADNPLPLTGAAGGHQHQGEGAFGRGEGENLRRVCHHDVARLGGGDVDMVETDAECGDDLRARWQGIDADGMEPLPGGP